MADVIEHTKAKDAEKARANRKVAIACAAFFCSMIGVAYASVPLYELFCRVTGFGGTTQVADTASEVVLDRVIKVRFDANTANALPWQFRPKVREVELKVGEMAEISYVAKNIAQRVTNGRASFNVTPLAAGAYFNKMQCFCFTDTALAPGEEMDMPVVFFVDPAIAENHELDKVTTITLSYTFFPIDAPETPLASVDVEGPVAAKETNENL